MGESIFGSLYRNDYSYAAEQFARERRIAERAQAESRHDALMCIGGPKHGQTMRVALGTKTVALPILGGPTFNPTSSTEPLRITHYTVKELTMYGLTVARVLVHETVTYHPVYVR